MLQARYFETALFFVIACIIAPLSSPAQTSALPTVQIKAGSSVITVEVARTPKEKALGLMHRRKLADNSGMIFVHDGKSRASFWMKNTFIPLSIAFIDAKGVILEIADMQPHDETAVQSASDHVAFALEMNQHWFALNRVKTGDRLLLENTTWDALFRGTAK